MADKRIDQLVAATTLGNNDLLVVEQNNQAKKLAGSALASFVYNAAGEKIEEVEQAIADAQSAVDSLEEQKDTIAQSIADMAQYGTDTTLSTTGVAADAKAAGDRIKAVETDALAGLDQAEITGVPIATFDDGADDVPVKKLVVGIEPVQNLHGYNNPWPAGGGKNLLDITGVSPTNTVYFCEPNGFLFKADTTYCFSVEAAGLVASIAIYSLDKTTQLAYVGGGNTNILLYTPESDTYGLPRLYRGSDGVTQETINKAMLEIGDSRTAFAPYANICPITGWTGANLTRTGKNLLDEIAFKTYSNWGNIVPNGSTGGRTDSSNRGYWLTEKAGTYTISFDFSSDFPTYLYICKAVNDYGERVSYITTNVISNNPYTFTVQNGEKWFLRSGNMGTQSAFNTTIAKFKSPKLELGSTATDYEEYSGNTYPITFPNEAGTVYGGTLDVTNGKLIVNRAYKEFDGSNDETWMYYSIFSGNLFRLSNQINDRETQFIIASATNIDKYKCNSYKPAADISSGRTTGTFSSSSADYLDFVNDNYSTLETWKTYLAQSPIQFVYPLATPIEYDLTPAQVTTLLGLNNIWTDTGYVLDLIYRRRPISDADIQEQIDIIRDAIAEREDTVIASKNYTVGSLIFVEDKLVEVTNPITTGESIVVDTNCSETTIAAQIGYLKSLVDGLGNLAYLSYENA